MGLIYLYYGRTDETEPKRFLADDLISERKKRMMEELKHMEDRLKRHITECKREVIKELLNMQSKKLEAYQQTTKKKKSVDLLNNALAQEID